MWYLALNIVGVINRVKSGVNWAIKESFMEQVRFELAWNKWVSDSQRNGKIQKKKDSVGKNRRAILRNVKAEKKIR